MSHFKAEMYQIRFHPAGQLTEFLLLRPPSWIKGVLLLKGGKGTEKEREGRRKGGRRRKGKGEADGKGGGGEGRDGTSPAWSSPDLGSTGSQ